MKIEKLQFEKQKVEVKETYIDKKDGKIKERTKSVLLPTPKCIKNVSEVNNKTEEMKD